MLFTRKLFLITLLAIMSSIFQNQVYGQERKTKNTLKNLIGKEVSFDSIETFIEAKMKTLNVPGLSLAIINDGKVVYHLIKGYADIGKEKKVSKSTLFEGASLSKPLFAYFIMSFVEEGIIDLDKPLCTYLPYEAIAHDERYKKITARMVLTHTTGFPNWRSDYKENKLFISFEPGTAFQYSGEGYQYLAKVLAYILKTDDAGLEKVYQKRVAARLKLKYTKFIQDSYNMKNKAEGYKDGKVVGEDDDPKIFGSAFSIHSEALDFSKWLIALMNKEGLSKESYDELFKTQFTLPDGHPQKQLGVTDWTLGFAKVTLPFGFVYGHGGNNSGYSSIFIIEPETKWGYIMFTNANQSQLPMVFLQYLMTP
ncbi:beta-lactamase family protein [Aquimarina sp. ERC-38]|uniref:serine hydrolase domain-containing protein n=1 Tax=Aquimarina sp. ERC-38 TaxID=2949996 RepID=UPI002246DB48|nr:serine hydrolase domain-containing protein [Aquimarina sp. ERC-38]UZO80138.1 beta-lactamase family protein [Aquimarina sp. ERC-38]